MESLTLPVAGRVRVQRFDAGGCCLADTGWHPNTVTNAFLNALAAWATGRNNTGANATPYPRQTQLGTGSGTPAVTDTALFAPASGTLIACSSLTTPSTPANTAQWVSVYTTPPGSYTEVGLFAPNGALYAHRMETVTITSGSQTVVTWQVTWSAG